MATAADGKKNKRKNTKKRKNETVNQLKINKFFIFPCQFSGQINSHFLIQGHCRDGSNLKHLQSLIPQFLILSHVSRLQSAGGPQKTQPDASSHLATSIDMP